MKEGKSYTKILPSKAGKAPWERIHPHLLVLTLGLFGSLLFFFFLVLALFYTRQRLEAPQNIGLPLAFFISSGLALVQSALLLPVLKWYRTDRVRAVFRHLGLAVVVGIAFLLAQGLGWLELAHQGIFLTDTTGEAYLWLLPGLHGLHVVAVVAVAIGFFTAHVNVIHDPVKALVFLTTPYRRVTLQLLVMAFHFIGAVWLMLFWAFLLLF